jgi:ABC-type glycerol-3-phosphate transport system substrate-binding protein
MMLLGDGNTSASQLLGSAVQNFLENGLDIQSVYASGDRDLPRPEANIFRKAYVSTYRFFASFSTQDYQVGNVEGDTLDVWVNHPRQYIEIMQMMIDSGFTEETGIDVKLSLMPDENKLILANAANYAPDVALGVNHWIPYEFAIRGASVDLRQFDGYEETISQFSEGVMVPYVFEEGMFGLPETQNFWVTFYREDILESLDIPVPDTWNEVIEILPELQRFDMNYYEPLAFFKGFKPFVATMPFIYQFGGTLYSEDGMTTAINSEETLEGMQMMTDLFTVYNMPKEVPNFYQHFRYGTMPVGISDLATYLQLTIAAPEIAGKWSIAPHPGVLNEETGEVERWAASGAQSSMILSASDQQEDAWKFLEWWMSTEVQTNFALRLQTTYGTEYLWNTANLEAFAQLPLPKEHIDTILTQWEYALEASRIPGAYMVEREISNAWNTIVFDDANPRITLDEATKTANREILYKMEEFGYVEDGVIVRPYRVPTIYNIEYWLKGRGQDD